VKLFSQTYLSVDSDFLSLSLKESSYSPVMNVHRPAFLKSYDFNKISINEFTTIFRIFGAV